MGGVDTDQGVSLYTIVIVRTLYSTPSWKEYYDALQRVISFAHCLDVTTLHQQLPEKWELQMSRASAHQPMLLHLL